MANIAAERLLSSMSPHMVLKGTVEIEFFAAKGARSHIVCRYLAADQFLFNILELLVIQASAISLKSGEW